MDVEGISAVTLAVRDMARSVHFYQAAGFELLHGGAKASFTSFLAGSGYLNLVLAPEHEVKWWGRAIFRVRDVDKAHEQMTARGLAPEASPRDAEWGERYFHIQDPDGHELSFAKLLQPAQ